MKGLHTYREPLGMNPGALQVYAAIDSGLDARLRSRLPFGPASFSCFMDGPEPTSPQAATGASPAEAFEGARPFLAPWEPFSFSSRSWAAFARAEARSSRSASFAAFFSSRAFSFSALQAARSAFLASRAALASALVRCGRAVAF